MKGFSAKSYTKWLEIWEENLIGLAKTYAKSERNKEDSYKMGVLRAFKAARLFFKIPANDRRASVLEEYRYSSKDRENPELRGDPAQPDNEAGDGSDASGGK